MLNTLPPSASFIPEAEHVSDNHPSTNGLAYSIVEEFGPEQTAELVEALQEFMDNFGYGPFVKDED